jgi:hypothetical protein
MKNTLCVLAAALAGSVQALAQVPAEWTFKIVAREGQTGHGVGLPAGAELVQNDPGLDDDGSACVRFTAAGGDGVFVYDAAVGSGQVVVSNASALYFSSIDMLSGRIALTSADGVEVRDKSGALLYSFPLGGNEGVTGSINRARLTTSGAVGYRAASGSTTKTLIDRYDGAQRIQTALASTAAGYTFLYSPTLNNAMQMASKADPVSGGNAVVRWEQGQPAVTILATAGSEYNLISNGTDLNDAGEVAFFARRTTDSQFELLKGSGGSLTRIAAAGDQGIANSAFANFPPVINNNGLVAFRPNNGGNRIYIGDGAELVYVVGDNSEIPVGDGTMLTLGAGTGSPRTSIVGNIALNSANQIAFIGRLSDGTDALIIATPVTAPACGTADFDGDGDTGTDADIEAFFACLAGNCCPTCWHLGADFDGDGDTGTDGDIEAFFRVLAGSPC